MMRVSPIATEFLVHAVHKAQHSNVFLTSMDHNPLAQYVFTSRFQLTCKPTKEFMHMDNQHSNN